MNFMMRVWCFVIVILFACNVACQAQSYQKDSLFLIYLLDKSQYTDLISEAKRLRQSHGKSAEMQLQTAYYQGIGNYFLRQLDSAAGYFGQVQTQSPFYWKSRFYQSFSQAYQHQSSQAIQVLDSLAPDDSLLIGLRNFQYAALHLLEGDETAFERRSQQFKGRFYAFAQQEQSLATYHTAIRQQKKQSAFKAAALSALVPGLGKIYARRTGQGIAAFLQCLVFGVQAYEGYRKDGFQSTRFLVYGSIFGVFYVGNIWGSALAVRINRQEFQDKTHEQILFDMHIPLRTIFP